MATIDLTLSLSDITKRTMSRTRGREAAQAVAERALESGVKRVLLDMTSESLVTASFVDELLQRASEMECNQRIQVIFIVSDEGMLGDFQKCVDLRNLECRYCVSTDCDHIDVLRPVKTQKPQHRLHMGEKSSLQTAG